MSNLTEKCNLHFTEYANIEYSEKNPLSIMFDTCVWKRLIKNTDQKFNSIYESIKSGSIKPFASDACLIEAIRKNGHAYKNERKKVLSDYAKTKIKIKSENNLIAIDIIPNSSAYICPDVLLDDINLAYKLGFKFISTCRTGFPHLESIGLFLPENPEFFNSRQNEAYKALQELNVGDFLIFEIAKKIRAAKKLNLNQNFLATLTFADDNQSKLIPDAISEMCDGDVVIGCYANNLDFLCTADYGKAAAKKRINSVFSDENKTKLKNKLGIKICGVDELSLLISSKLSKN